MQRPFPNGHKFPFGCNGFVTAVAAGQRQHFYSGVGIFNFITGITSDASRGSQIPRLPWFHLETRGLMLALIYIISPFLACDLRSTRAGSSYDAATVQLKRSLCS